MISNCGHDENNRLSGGKAGDQSGNEYCVRTWYNRPWKCVLRHPDAKVRNLLAVVAKAAAKNNKVGYDQSQRGTYYNQLKAAKWKPKNIKVACEADCSSSTAANVIAVGYRLDVDKLKDVNPACTTSNLRAALKLAGFKVLSDDKYLTSDAYLLPGDVLLNDGVHVAINLDEGAKVDATTTKAKCRLYKAASTLEGKVAAIPSGSVITFVRDVGDGWSQVIYEGKKGYAKNTCIKGVKGLSKYPAAKVSKAVYLRGKRRKGKATRIKKLPVGTTLKLVCVGKSKKWAAVVVNGMKGFVIRKKIKKV